MEEEGRSLDKTSTWAIAAVFGSIFFISCLFDKLMNWVGKLLTRKTGKTNYMAYEKVKDELIVLGFISLLLTFLGKHVTSICIPIEVAKELLPCRLMDEEKTMGGPGSCNKGSVPLMTMEGVHELHIFIIWLAVVHVLLGLVTMKLVEWKMNSWKRWEDEGFKDESSCGSGYTCTTFSAQTLLGCFCRQFWKSITKRDYLALRTEFMTAQISGARSGFNFQKYIIHSLDDDFKMIVSIRNYLWLVSVCFLLLNFKNTHILCVGSILLLLVTVGVGTYLQFILKRRRNTMERDIEDRVATQARLSEWPHLVLHTLNVTLFLISFHLAFFLWTLV